MAIEVVVTQDCYILGVGVRNYLPKGTVLTSTSMNGFLEYEIREVVDAQEVEGYRLMAIGEIVHFSSPETARVFIEKRKRC